MALRTILSPGVEITERDISQYTTGPVGTGVLVVGFASKGRDYDPMNITSRSSWLTQFGEPTNEAERYFFNACMEVINQGGRLYACKLPYKNDSLNKFTAHTYKVESSTLYPITTVAEYIRKYDIQNQLLKGDFYKFTAGDKNDLYNFSRAKSLYDKIKEFDEAVDKCVRALPYVYFTDIMLGELNREDGDDDNWVTTQAEFIYKKLEALFNPDSPFRAVFDEEMSVTLNLSSLNEDGTVPFAELPQKFAEAYEEAFGPVDTDRFKNTLNPSRVNLVTLQYEYPDLSATKLWKFFKEDNEEFFAKLKEKLETTEKIFEYDDKHYDGLFPYVYFDDEHCNLGTYYRAVKRYPAIKRAREIIENADVIDTIDGVLDLDYSLRKNGMDYLKSAARDVNPAFCGLTAYSDFERWADAEEAALTASTVLDDLRMLLCERKKDEEGKPQSVSERICNLEDAFKELFKSPEFKKIQEHFSDEQYSPTQFAKKSLGFYADRTLIDNIEDKKNLKIRGSDFNWMFKVDDPESDDPDAFLEGVDFYHRYSEDSDLSDLNAQVEATVDEVTYAELISYVDEFKGPNTLFPFLATFAEKPEFAAIKVALDALDKDKIAQELKYAELAKADPSLKQYMRITSEDCPELKDLEEIDGWATGEVPVTTDRLVIVDKTRAALKRAFTKDANGDQKELVGIIPVVTTAANALYAQSLLETGETGVGKYQAFANAKTIRTDKISDGYDFAEGDLAVPFYSDEDGAYTVSTTAANSFPSIHYKSDGELDKENLKKIGIVVFKAFLDPGEGNKVNFDLVEAYVGELDKDAVNPNTGATTFIDKIVNAQSEYIEVYSNCFNQPATRERYKKVDLFIVEDQTAGNLGFFEYMTKKNVSLVDSITKALPLVWEKNEDINEKEIDIVCDAGVSNIAQYIKSVFGKQGEYNPSSTDASLFKLRSKEDTKVWRAVLDSYDTFCKKMRKDCMFVADGPRPFCLQGEKKIVRASKPTNTIDGNILPLLKYITGVNTNYGAGYCDWFQKADEFSGDYFWCPPSIQAMGVYLNTDINHNYWSAPAGLNRGVLNVLDAAFSPTQKQADEIYPKCWNYARVYPNDGVVLEGQRTFQTKETALDRVNVRRAMLRFERIAYQIARWFVYEDNTVETRQRLYDALDGVYKQIKGLGGMIDYKIICDETINTPEVIDRNELRVKIGIKPTKTAEFILIEFNVVRQGLSNWNEIL